MLELFPVDENNHLSVDSLGFFPTREKFVLLVLRLLNLTVNTVMKEYMLLCGLYTMFYIEFQKIFTQYIVTCILL